MVVYRLLNRINKNKRKEIRNLTKIPVVIVQYHKDGTKWLLWGVHKYKPNG